MTLHRTHRQSRGNHQRLLLGIVLSTFALVSRALSRQPDKATCSGRSASRSSNETRLWMRWSRPPRCHTRCAGADGLRLRRVLALSRISSTTFPISRKKRYPARSARGGLAVPQANIQLLKSVVSPSKLPTTSGLQIRVSGGLQGVFISSRLPAGP